MTQQELLLVNKDLLLLKQDQACSNDIMCRLLSELEKLAFVSGYKGKPMFNYYSNSQMKEKEIIDQITFQMNVFQTSFQSFLRTHNNKYEYPENLSRETIDIIINNWIDKVNKTKPNNTIFFLDFLNLINSKSLSQRCQMVFNNLGKKDEPMNKRELKRQMNNFTNAGAIIGDGLNKVEEELSLNGNYSHQIQLNKKREDNPLYQRLNIKRELIDSYSRACDQNLLYIMAYLEYIACYFDKTLTAKYQYALTDNTISLLNIKDRINKRLYEFYDYYLKLDEYDGYEFPMKFSLDIIENQIKKWKKKIIDQNYKSIFDGVLKQLQNPKELTLI